ncbi:hypothetical protein D3C87_1744950 [compost metagenome]
MRFSSPILPVSSLQAATFQKKKIITKCARDCMATGSKFSSTAWHSISRAKKRESSRSRSCATARPSSRFRRITISFASTTAMRYTTERPVTSRTKRPARRRSAKWLTSVISMKHSPFRELPRCPRRCARCALHSHYPFMARMCNINTGSKA